MTQMKFIVRIFNAIQTMKVATLDLVEQAGQAFKNLQAFTGSTVDYYKTLLNVNIYLNRPKNFSMVNEVMVMTLFKWVKPYHR